MKRLFWISTTAVLALALTACGSSPSASGGGDQTTQAAQSAATSSTGQQAASNGGPQGTPGQGGGFRASPQMQTFNQVSVEIWYLADTKDANTLTKDQATKLLAIYQDFQTEMQPAAGATPAAATPQAGGGNGGGPRGGGFGPMDPAKVQTDLTAIQAVFTPDQLTEINKLTQDQITAEMQAHGLNFGNRQGGGNGGNGGPRPTPDANQIATFQAQATANPRPAGNPFLNETLKVLQAILAG